MGDITSDVAGVADNMIGEMFGFADYVATNFMQEFLLLMLLSVVAGVIWGVARRFLGRG